MPFPMPFPPSHRCTRALGALGLVAAPSLLGASAALAQTPPRSYEASPTIYKVAAENEQFRVITVVWKPGERDLMHSHPASAVYYLSDCELRLQGQGGAPRDVSLKAGFALVQPPVPGHVVENIGKADCRLVMFEPR
jgi:beta-alanine degradation protein BauB